jgi:hypothetical protein
MTEPCVFPYRERRKILKDVEWADPCSIANVDAAVVGH